MATLAVPVQYDERTGVIEPRGRGSADWAQYVAELGYRVIEPLMGWAPYAWLVQYGDPDGPDGWGYALLTDGVA